MKIWIYQSLRLGTTSRADLEVESEANTRVYALSYYWCYTIQAPVEHHAVINSPRAISQQDNLFFGSLAANIFTIAVPWTDSKYA